MGQNTDPTFPQNRPNWQTSGITPGNPGSHDPAALQISREVELANSALPQFGVFVSPGAAGNITVVLVAGTEAVGIALVENNSRDFANRKYGKGDRAAVARRGFFWVKMDPANPLADTNAAIFISSATNLEGYVTSLNDITTSALGSGVSIESIKGDSVELYLDGSAIYTLTP